MGAGSGSDSSSAGEARVLARGLVTAGALSLFTAAVPFSPTAPTRLAAACGLAALVLGAALGRWAGSAPRVLLQAVLVLATTVVTACVAASTTPAGLVVTSYGYVWIAVFAAWFHRGRVAAGHVAGIGAGLAAALHVADAVSPVQTWVFVVGTVAMVTGSLSALVGRLRRAADHDPLTGLLNRAAFARAAGAAMTRAARTGRPLTLAVLDLDGFKQLNDSRGHAAGDRLLVHLAGSWSGAVRSGDLLARQGGDEFVLLMPATDLAEGLGVLERLRGSTAEGSWTAGAAQWAGEDLDGLLAEADADLYQRKRARAGAPGPRAAEPTPR